MSRLISPDFTVTTESRKGSWQFALSIQQTKSRGTVVFSEMICESDEVTRLGVGVATADGIREPESGPRTRETNLTSKKTKTQEKENFEKDFRKWIQLLLRWENG